MINLVMQLLKVLEEEVKVLGGSILILLHSQTYSKIFLEILLVGDQQEDLTTEEMT